MHSGRAGGHGGNVRVKQEIAMADPMQLKVTPGGTLDSYSVARRMAPFGRPASTKMRLARRRPPHGEQRGEDGARWRRRIGLQSAEMLRC
jgi:hypothetical protein